VSNPVNVAASARSCDRASHPRAPLIIGSTVFKTARVVTAATKSLPVLARDDATTTLAEFIALDRQRFVSEGTTIIRSSNGFSVFGLRIKVEGVIH
jgi:hypothetical protein